MKAALKQFFLLIALLVPLVCSGQAKLYTKKARLSDFSSKVTKVVISSESILELHLKNEFYAHWSLSPYEYCTVAEYEEHKTDNNCYFMRLVSDRGLVYLTLTKGGRENDPDMLKRPLEVASIAIASERASSGREFLYMGAFVEILQQFVGDAISSDGKGYTGLQSYNVKNLKGWEVCVDAARADSLFSAAAPGVLTGVVIAPSDVYPKSVCCKMLISAETHELLLYTLSPYRSPSDAEFTKKDIKRIIKRGGKLSE